MKRKSGNSDERGTPTPRQKSDLCRFYYGNESLRRCFVCQKEASNPEYHHVNEKKSRSQTIFENLIPLCATCNKNIELSKPEYHNTKIDPDVQPERLLDRAQWWFASSKNAASYACYRIAAHLFRTRNNDCDRQLRCLAYAVGSLRPSGELRLVRHTILEAKETFQLAGDNASPFCRAEFLSQLGLLLFDFGFFAMGFECAEYAYHTIKTICGRALLGLPPRSDIDQLIANHARRVAFTMTGVVHMPARFEAEILDHLTNDQAVFLKGCAYRGYTTNLDVKAYRDRERKGSVSTELRDSADAALRYETRIGNEWVRASHHANRGLCFREDYRHYRCHHNREKAIEDLRSACTIYRDLTICPEPNVGNTPYPDDVLRSLGYADVPLISHRGTFPLTYVELCDVVKIVKEGI